MTDAALGFLLLGIAMLVVLGIVFAIASRGGSRRDAQPEPPPGVHMPGPSYLPVVFSVAAALIGAGLAFRGDWAIANPFVIVPGILLLVVGVAAWVRAANHEWHDVEHGGHHDDGAAH